MCVTLTSIQNPITQHDNFALNLSMCFKEFQRQKAAYCVYSDIYHFCFSSWIPDVPFFFSGVISFYRKYFLSSISFLFFNTPDFLYLNFYFFAREKKRENNTERHKENSYLLVHPHMPTKTRSAARSQKPGTRKIGNIGRCKRGS